MTQIVAMPVSAMDILAEHNRDTMKPGKSTILFEIEYTPEPGERVPVIVHDYEGGSADIEQESGMLEWTIADLLPDDVREEGVYVMGGFYGHFSKDYYGEVDCDFEFGSIRPANATELRINSLDRGEWDCHEGDGGGEPLVICDPQPNATANPPTTSENTQEPPTQGRCLLFAPIGPDSRCIAHRQPYAMCADPTKGTPRD